MGGEGEDANTPATLPRPPSPFFLRAENFLEFLNSILLTGEVAGLFAKDELLAMSADLRNAFVAARPGLPDSTDNLKQVGVAQGVGYCASSSWRQGAANWACAAC